MGNLKTGTLIIGCINLAGAFIVLLSVLALLGLSSWANNANYEEICQKMMELMFMYGMYNNGTYLILLAVKSALIVAVSSVLIHGARKGRPGLLTPFILLSVFNVVRGFIMIFYLIITGQFTMVFIEVIGFAFEVYFVIIVLNFKNELKMKDTVEHFVGYTASNI